MEQQSDSSLNITEVVPVTSTVTSTNTTTTGSVGWFTLYRGWPTSSTAGFESEVSLLTKWGGLTESTFCQENVLLSSIEDDGQRFINTVIVDQNNLTDDATDRVNVVLCHGFGSGVGFLYRNMGAISKSIPKSRIFAMDWLGMGRSGRPPFPKYQLITPKKDEETSQKQQQDAAINFFLDSFEEWRQKQVGLEKFILLGHSMGGYLAALYALRHPDRVQKLILASPVGLPIPGVDPQIAVTGHRMSSWMTHLWDNNYTPQGLIRAMGPLGPRFAHSYIHNRYPNLSQGEKLDLGKYFYHISAAPGSGEYALAALLAPGAWAREPLHNHLRRIAMPCTFMYGRHDWMDRRHAEEAAQYMTVPVKIVSVEDAGHNLNLDNPDEFNRIACEEVMQIIQE